MSIIPYSEWGSRGQGGTTIGPVSTVIVHHWFRPHIGANAARSREADALRSVESYHTDTNGWGPGTGYQFHAFASGRKWEGRGWRRSGAHTVGKNGSSVAIALPIDGDQHEPTEAQTQAVADIIREGVEQGHIEAGYRVRGHRDYSSKSCPGDRVSDAWLRNFEDLDRPAQPDTDDDMESLMAKLGPPMELVKTDQGRWLLVTWWPDHAYSHIASEDGLDRLINRAERDDVPYITLRDGGFPEAWLVGMREDPARR